MSKFIWFDDVCGTDSMNVRLLENKSDISRIKKCFRTFKAVTEFEDLDIFETMGLIGMVCKIHEDKYFYCLLLGGLDVEAHTKHYIIAIKKEDWNDENI